VREPYHQNTVNTFRSSRKAGFGKIPDLARGKVPEDWWYFPVVARLHNERTGYPTQKPVALLERIILASSNPGEIVADFFSGSGTTVFVAAHHGRKFIAVDQTFRAIHTTRSRLVETNSSFTLENDIAYGIPISPPPATTQARLLDGVVSLKTKLDLDYWEVDPAWNGKIFKSAAQAKRPVRSGDLPVELKTKTGGDICIRCVTANGRQYQLNI
jgi:DNA methylase